MIPAQNIQSKNLLDLDSNLNVIYQLIDGLRQTTPQVLVLRDNQARYGGYNSDYVDMQFEYNSTNFYSTALSYDTDEHTITVDPTLYTNYVLDGAIQYYVSTTNSTATIYFRIIEIDENGTETTLQPFYRMPVGTLTSGHQKVLHIHQNFSVKSTTKKIKFQITTNDTVQPSMSAVSFELTGLSANMN